jgi:hypothetical protein
MLENFNAAKTTIGSTSFTYTAEQSAAVLLVFPHQNVDIVLFTLLGGGGGGGCPQLKNKIKPEKM